MIDPERLIAVLEARPLQSRLKVERIARYIEESEGIYERFMLVMYPDREHKRDEHNFILDALLYSYDGDVEKGIVKHDLESMIFSKITASHAMSLVRGEISGKFVHILVNVNEAVDAWAINQDLLDTELFIQTTSGYLYYYHEVIHS